MARGSARAATPNGPWWRTWRRRWRTWRGCRPPSAWTAACWRARSPPRRRDRMAAPRRVTGLAGLQQAFDEVRFGAARTLNLRASLPTASEAAARVDSWLRQHQVQRSDEVLVITGRGNNSEGGVSVVREA